MTIDQIKQMIEEEHYKLQKELYEEACSNKHVKKETSSGSGGSNGGFSAPLRVVKKESDNPHRDTANATDMKGKSTSFLPVEPKILPVEPKKKKKKKKIDKEALAEMILDTLLNKENQ